MILIEMSTLVYFILHSASIKAELIFTRTNHRLIMRLLIFTLSNSKMSHSLSRTCKYLAVSILFFLILGNSAIASRYIYESFVANDENKIELIGELSGGQFGASITTGDFNNDGVEDLVVGSPFASIGFSEWNGMVSIVFGGKEIDGSKSFSDINIYGEHSGDQFGTSVAVGDFNNDNIDDLAISAHNAYLDQERAGKVYLFYGQSNWQEGSINLSISEPDVLFIGHSDGDAFGLALEALDINNDSIDDLLIGAPYASFSEVKNTGMVYAYYGLEEGFPTHLYNLNERSADVTFYGQNEDEAFGSVINGGYITSDDKMDIVIGAYGSSTDDLEQSGKVYIYRGLKTFLTKVKSPTCSINGTVSNSWFGFALDVNDANQDGKDDIAVSSFPYKGDRSTAKVSVFYGGEHFAIKDSFYTGDEDFADIVINSPSGENFLGANVLMHDLNTDSIPEIILGAPGISYNSSIEEGDVYVLYSQGKGYNQSYSIEQKEVTSSIHGENADDWFGFSVAVLDFNNDGLQDLAIGSRYSDTSDSANNGKVFILLDYSLPHGSLTTVLETEDKLVNRGEFISKVVLDFNLKEKKSDYIANCHEYKEFCFFNFTAMSLYDDLQLEPIPIIYPDVSQTNPYYEDILIGTMLGLINGYMNEENSPFYPNLHVSRIHALKVVLGAAEAVNPMYRFELMDLLGGYSGLTSQHSSFVDVDPKISHMWWYPRYVNFALEKNIIDKGDYFRPDDNITYEELNDMIIRVQEYLNQQNAEVES